MMKKILIVSLVLSLFLLMGCTQEVPVEESGALETVDEVELGSDYTVLIENGKFYPIDLEISVGDSVEWVNVDRIGEEDNGVGDNQSENDIGEGVLHTVTFENGLLDEELPTKGQASHTFEEAGTFDYYCQYHPEMRGTIVVKE